MSATLAYVGIGSVLAVGVAILTVAVLFLRTARRYVDLAEERLELLREGEALLLKVAQQQGLVSEESQDQESERTERITGVVGHRRGQRTGEESPGNLRPQQEQDRHVRAASSIRGQVSSSTEDGEQGRERILKASAPGTAASWPKDGPPLLRAAVAHPDDEVTPRVWNSSAAKFFQKCYDRYLEHYEGYVRLAERIHRMRSEASPGTLMRREWEDKLRRAYDAIERTTQRLDVLEAHYPELATDSERLSARLGIARLHAELTKRFGRWR
ncbi:MAG: hypothetical protein M3151_08440 [Actinomycetota bacterium]|nr:hypothetical protein [Actinomycetota bacterium]